MGEAARREVARWDWRASTQHLLRRQYPIAIAAAMAQYGPDLGAGLRDDEDEDDEIDLVDGPLVWEF